jgi:hypothetical protein
LKLLYDFDCVDIVKFRENLSHFPDTGSTAIIRPNGDVQAIKVKFAREFWFASGKEFVKKVGFWQILPGFLACHEHFYLDFY